MTETTKEERDSKRTAVEAHVERVAHLGQVPRVMINDEFLVRLLNDADRLEELEARLRSLQSGIWVRASLFHEDKESNANYHCDEYTHPFVVEAFDIDPGEYTHRGGTPAQFRVRVPIRALYREEDKKKETP